MRALLVPASVAVAAWVLVACSGSPYAKGTLRELFPDGPRPERRDYLVDDRRIHYVEQKGGPARIVFIHGSPGDWQGWASYLAKRKLQDRATMLAVDRPGWGRSEDAGLVVDLAEQAKLLEPLLKGSSTATILVAHSYGGAVASEIALDFPSEVSGLVLVAPTLSARLEAPRWYERLEAAIPGFLLPDKLSRSREELAVLPQELQKLRSRWADLHIPVTVIQGEDDLQVDPETIEFAQRVLSPDGATFVRVKDQGHWILWEEPNLVAKAVAALLDQISDPPTPNTSS